MRRFIRVSLFHLFAIILFVADFGIMQPGVDAVAEAQTSGGGTDTVMSGTIDLSTVGANFIVPIVNGQGVLGADITGLTGSGATLVTEGTVNGTLWTPLNMLVAGSGGGITASLTADNSVRSNTSGKTWVRVRVSVAGAGTAAITTSLSTNSSITAMSAPLPTGANTIGGVTVTNFPASQPISGSVSVSNFPSSQPVTGTFWQATQPISGTVGISGTVTTSSATCANAPTTQVVIGTTAVQVVAARAGRYRAIVAPTTNATYYVGTTSSVTTSTGLPILGGGSFSFASGLALYAVAASSMTLGAMECY